MTPARTTKRRFPFATGLRARLIMAFVLVVLIAAGGTAAAVTVTVRSWIYSNAQSMVISEFRTEMSALNGTSVDAVNRTDLYRVLPPDVTSYVDGELLTLGTAKESDIGQGFADGNDTPEEISFRRVGATRLLVGTVIAVNDTTGHTQGLKVYTIRPLPGVRDKIAELIWVVAISLAAGVVFCIALGAWIATLLVRPLGRLNTAAARAADGDLTVRLPESGVSELAQVTSTFNHMIQQHNSTLEQSRRFVADVSHELRTPLAALVPVSEVLSEERDRLPPDSAVAAEIVALEIGKLTRLVDDLMEISRHDSRRATLRTEPVDLPDLVRQTLASRGWHDQVSLYTPTELVVSADLRRLEIVIANLVGNALRHGGDPVEVSIDDLPGVAVLRVSDHGPGIPPEHLGKIFDRFYKSDTARGRSDGSGLGLSLADENVRLHGGTIAVDSTPDNTVFTVRLPR